MKIIDGILILDRCDLIESEVGKKIEDITLYDFKLYELNVIKTIKDHDLVKFIDRDGSSKILKNKTNKEKTE